MKAVGRIVMDPANKNVWLRTLSKNSNPFHVFDTYSVRHAHDGVIQPQQITVTEVKDMTKEESLPVGLDFPSFPFFELPRLISPNIFSQKTPIYYMLCKFHCYNLFYINYINYNHSLLDNKTMYFFI